MNSRAERRRKDRQDKKVIEQGEDMQSFQMEMELIQPWSNFVMRTKLPPLIFDAMIKITDEILDDQNKKNWGDNLAGQIADEPLIPHSILQREGIYGFFLETVGEYVKNAIRQQATQSDFHKVKDIEWKTKMMSMWIISQVIFSCFLLIKFMLFIHSVLKTERVKEEVFLIMQILCQSRHMKMKIIQKIEWQMHRLKE